MFIMSIESFKNLILERNVYESILFDYFVEHFGIIQLL